MNKPNVKPSQSFGPLRKKFPSRNALTSYIREEFREVLDPQDAQVSPYRGTRAVAEQRLREFDVQNYARTRNFYHGNVTRLSPYIRHGLVEQRAIIDHVLKQVSVKQCEKFLQELCWRSFWQWMYRHHPEAIWHDIEHYKTGWQCEDYSDTLPPDIQNAQTECACINHFIQDLLSTGYMHNHTRMYVAAYIVHWRRVKWQAGAQWFLSHLVDGDAASNNLSWQWIASTFSNRPYIFNLDNVRKYCGDAVNCKPQDNQPLDDTYEVLNARLFPRGENL